jgi:hypothetical protein
MVDLNFIAIVHLASSPRKDNKIHSARLKKHDTCM